MPKIPVGVPVALGGGTVVNRIDNSYLRSMLPASIANDEAKETKDAQQVRPVDVRKPDGPDSKTTLSPGAILRSQYAQIEAASERAQDAAALAKRVEATLRDIESVLGGIEDRLGAPGLGRTVREFAKMRGELTEVRRDMLDEARKALDIARANVSAVDPAPNPDAAAAETASMIRSFPDRASFLHAQLSKSNIIELLKP
jgi:hypothetical protein